MPASTPLNILETEILNVLSDLGSQQVDARTKVASFLAKIQPDIDAAIKDNDSMSMNFLRDRTAMAVAQIDLGLYQAEKQRITDTVITVLRVLIAVGVAVA